MKIAGLRETDFEPVSFTEEEKKVLYLATLQLAIDGNFVQIDKQKLADRMGYANKASANTAVYSLRINLVRKAGMASGGQAPDVTIDNDGKIVIKVHDSAHPGPSDAESSATKHAAAKISAESSRTKTSHKPKVKSDLNEEEVAIPAAKTSLTSKLKTTSPRANKAGASNTRKTINRRNASTDSDENGTDTDTLVPSKKRVVNKKAISKPSTTKTEPAPSSVNKINKRKSNPNTETDIESSPEFLRRSTRSQATLSTKSQDNKKQAGGPGQPEKNKGVKTAQTLATSPLRISLAQAQKNMGTALDAFLAKEAAEGEFYDLN